MVTNRILAQVVWLLMAIVLLASFSKTRLIVRDTLLIFLLLLRRFLIWMALGWLIIIVYVAYALGFWDSDLMVATVWWSLASGSVLFYDAATSTYGMKFVSYRLRKLVSVTLIVEALIVLVEMPLLFELFLVPVSFIAMAWLTFLDNESARPNLMTNCIKYLAPIIGPSLIAFNIWSWVNDRVSVSIRELVREAFLPAYLTITFIPFLYCLAIYSKWELCYRKIKNVTSTEPHVRRLSKRVALVWAVMRESGVDLKSSHFLTVPVILDRIFSSCKPSEVRRSIRSQREKERQDAVQKREVGERLERYSGVVGVDEQGRQLDRREFRETCEMLQWLYNCHAGWWRKNERYRVGLKDLVLVGPPTDPFPSDSFQEVVSNDADSWFAWRRTAPGWVFAIGANGPPPSCWSYDGPDPPGGTPCEGATWKNLEVGEWSFNWV